MVIEKYGVYPKAFKEISELIKFFPRSEYRKIPKSFINFIEENMDNNYDYIVEHIDDFQNQEMLDETKIILSIIYRDFIALDKYNPDNLFKDKTTKIELVGNSIAMVEYKESIFTKIKNWFKLIFNK